MVKTICEAERSIRKVDYSLTMEHLEGHVLPGSLYVVEDIKTGEKISEKNIRNIRPSYGMHPNI